MKDDFKSFAIAALFIALLTMCGLAWIFNDQLSGMEKTVTRIEKRMDAIAWVATRYKGQQSKENQEWMKRDKKIIELSVDNDRVWDRIGGHETRITAIEEWRGRHDPVDPDINGAKTEGLMPGSHD